MATDSQIQKPKDLSKINSNDINELLWWTYQLGITPEKLLSIIQQFGSSTEQVKQHINDRK